MKRLDQGHLNSKLEVPGLTCPDRESNPGLHGGGEYSRKEPFEQLVNCNSEHLHMSARPVENVRGMYLFMMSVQNKADFRI
jgi:hypothetical protein